MKSCKRFPTNFAGRSHFIFTRWILSPIFRTGDQQCCSIVHDDGSSALRASRIGQLAAQNFPFSEIAAGWLALRGWLRSWMRGWLRRSALLDDGQSSRFSIY